MLLAGDDESFARSRRRHARPLAGYLMRMTGDAEAAADLSAAGAQLRPRSGRGGVPHLPCTLERRPLGVVA
jgi:hypothetical protein